MSPQNNVLTKLMFSDMQKQWSSSKYEGSINCFNCSQIFGKDTLWTSLFVTVTVEDKVFQ